MPLFKIKDRLVPYRLLAYLLYAPPEDLEWLQKPSEDEVRVFTGPASRAFRIKVSALWEALYWLERQELVHSVTKEQKKGKAVVKLKQPTNINN